MNNKLSAYLLVAFMLSACSYNNSGSERKEISSEQEKIETTLLPEATPIFEVAYVHPQPVITRGDRGTAHNKFGFEGGRAHKINGTYHLFTTEPYADPVWIPTRLAHWKSLDGLKWERVGHVMQSNADTTGMHRKAALWSPMTYWLSEEDRWYLSYVDYMSALDLDTAFRRNMHGRIMLARSLTSGIEGIGGPYEDTLMLMEPDENSQAWEGLQGVNSWYPYQLDDGTWRSFYGSAQSQYFPIPFWGVGLAESASFFGSWQRAAHGNPVLIDTLFVENPVVDRLADGRFVAFVDGGPKTMFAYSVSDDGINWSRAIFIDLEKHTQRWWAKPWGMRTPLGLIKEGDGMYTLFFTAKDAPEDDEYSGFGHVGMCKLKLVDHKK